MEPGGRWQKTWHTIKRHGEERDSSKEQKKRIHRTEILFIKKVFCRHKTIFGISILLRLEIDFVHPIKQTTKHTHTLASFKLVCFLFLTIVLPLTHALVHILYIHTDTSIDNGKTKCEFWIHKQIILLKFVFCTWYFSVLFRWMWCQTLFFQEWDCKKNDTQAYTQTIAVDVYKCTWWQLIQGFF